MKAIIPSCSLLAGVPHSVICNTKPSLVLSWCLVSRRTVFDIAFLQNNLDLPKN